MNSKLANHGWSFVVALVLGVLGMWLHGMLGSIVGLIALLAVAYGAWGLTKTDLANDTVAKIGAWLAALGTLVVALVALLGLFSVKGLGSVSMYAGYAWLIGLLLVGLIALFKGKMEMGLLVLVALVLIVLPMYMTIGHMVMMIMGWVALLLLGVSLMRNN